MKNSLLLFLGTLLLAGCTASGVSQQSVPPMPHAFKASLSGGQEVLPVPGNGEGSADFELNSVTKKLTWNVRYSGLSSPATAADLSGPAKRGKNAAVEINLSSAGMKNPLTGSAVLTDTQINDLITGMTYVSIHTEQNPNGEIRGQIIPQSQ